MKSEEMLDVVNENDEVLEQRSKKEIHDKKLLHRCGTILIFKDDSYKEVLIQKRSLKKKTSPGQLGFTGGHIDAGEDYLIGLKREIQEELFYNKKMPDLKFEELFKFLCTGDGDTEIMGVFRTIYDGEFSLDPEEVDSVFFINIEELEKRMTDKPGEFTETNRQIFEEYKKFMKNENKKLSKRR